MPRLQGLIFDLEGTLVDGSYDLRQALNAALKSMGRREVSLDEVKAFSIDGMLPMVHRAFAATGEPIAEADSYARFQIFIKHYRNQAPDPAQILPDVVETLERFDAQGVLLGICTNNAEAATKKLLEGLGLSRYFACIAGGDTFQFHKPNPAHVLGVIERLGVPAENCAMIGDSERDILAAHGAKIPCLALHLPPDCGADGFIKGFREIPESLTKLGFQFS
ncbi:MAG: HAD-IA family hydrolase [Bdellovibrionales bacterium]